ncbi:MAG: single-stranded DNA-binding protein [Deltaproteobacteria bacterium]|jgi:single-strand DNA-binding protein|nr:single-stranded DNA-binding protein [Deltaproteobacteria bacterium]
MSGVNKAILLGRLGRDPELRFTSSGKSMATFSLATSERWGDEEKTEWHRIVMYDRLAETANTYLRKGDQVYLEGKIQTRAWNDKAGAKHSRTEIVAGFMQMLGSPRPHPHAAGPAAPPPAEARAPAFREDGPQGDARGAPEGQGPAAPAQAQRDATPKAPGVPGGLAGFGAPGIEGGKDRADGGKPGGFADGFADDGPLPTDDDMPF